MKGRATGAKAHIHYNTYAVLQAPLFRGGAVLHSRAFYIKVVAVELRSGHRPDPVSYRRRDAKGCRLLLHRAPTDRFPSRIPAAAWFHLDSRLLLAGAGCRSAMLRLRQSGPGSLPLVFSRARVRTLFPRVRPDRRETRALRARRHRRREFLSPARPGLPPDT